MAVRLLDHQVEIPSWVRDLDSFRRWSLSDEFPDRGRIDFVGGDVEVDMTPEDLGTHGDPKVAVLIALGALVDALDLGRVWVDSTRVVNAPAGLSCEPDVVLCLWGTLESGRARLVPKASRAEGRHVELEGAPDLVVEVVSDSSVKKDVERLRARYHAAGIREYWIVDARGAELSFHVLARGQDDFGKAPIDAEGYARSAVLDRRVRLTRSPARLGLHRYRLELAEPAPS